MTKHEPGIADGSRVCVGALLSKDGFILLGHRSAGRAFYPNVWDLPGGHCEKGETLEQALVRELREEIGVTPRAWLKLGTLSADGGSAGALQLHVYLVTRWTGTESNLQPEEHDRIGWFAVDDACRLPLAHPNYPQLFRRAVQRSRVSDP
ncbi:MAG: NUDIX domain-containing protein [Chloroflexota bacterium]